MGKRNLIHNVAASVEEGKFSLAKTQLAEISSAEDYSDQEQWLIALLRGLLSEATESPEKSIQSMFELQRSMPGTSAELRIAKQIAMFHCLLEGEGALEQLQEAADEIEALDRQCQGRFRAGALCVLAALAEARGQLVEAQEYIERAWSRSESRGGWCEAEMTSFMVLVLGRLGREVDAINWGIGACSGNQTLRNKKCCQVRDSYATLLLHQPSDSTKSLLTQDLFADLDELEDATFRATFLAGLVRASSVRCLSPIRQAEAATLETLNQLDKRPRSQIELSLACLDLELSRLLPNRDWAKVEQFVFLESYLLTTLEKGPLARLPSEQLSVRRINALLDIAGEAADRLDERFDCSFYNSLLLRRKNVLMPLL